MAKTKNKGGATPPARYAASIAGDRPVLALRFDGNGRVFPHIRQKWLIETPEEGVRQEYVVSLHNEYGFDLDQMDEELHVAGRGSAKRGPTWLYGERSKTRRTARPR